MKKWLLFCLIISFFSISLYAYETTDQSAIMLLLPRDWSQHKLGETNNSIHFLITNDTLHALDIQQITYSILKKDNQDVEKNMNQLYATLKNNLQMKDCAVGDLKFVTTDSVPFKEWAGHYQCQSKNIIGTIVMVDADPVNMYLFSYQISASLPQDKNNLVSMIQICYKKDPQPKCYFLLPENT